MTPTPPVFGGGPPPHSIDAEQCLLGAILDNNEAYHRVSSIVREEDFYEPVNARIFGVIAGLIRAGKLANPITVQQFLPADVDIAGVKLGQYLARLAAETTTVINAPDYADIIRDHSVRRQMLVELETAALACAAPTEQYSPDDVASRLIDSLDVITSERAPRRSSAPTLQQAVSNVVDHCAKAYEADGRLMGTTWGLQGLDDQTSGLQPGDYIIIGARPSVGKSGVVVSLSRRIAEAGNDVFFSSLEMRSEALIVRALSDIAYDERRPLPYFNMWRGNFRSDDWERVTRAALSYAALPIKIDDTPALSAAQIAVRMRKHARFLQRQGRRLAVGIIDHLHCVASGDRYKGKKTEEVGEASATFKALAKDLDCAIIALAQLSRKTEDEKRPPNLADLKWSGEIEQDADTVILLHRESYRLERELQTMDERHPDYLETMHKLNNCAGKVDIICAKQRMGPTFCYQANFNLACNALRDKGRDEHMPDGWREPHR